MLIQEAYYNLSENETVDQFELNYMPNVNDH